MRNRTVSRFYPLGSQAIDKRSCIHTNHFRNGFDACRFLRGPEEIHSTRRSSWAALGSSSTQDGESPVRPSVCDTLSSVLAWTLLSPDSICEIRACVVPACSASIVCDHPSSSRRLSTRSPNCTLNEFIYPRTSGICINSDMSDLNSPLFAFLLTVEQLVYG